MKCICILQYANEFVLLAKEETVLQDITDKLIVIGTFYGTETNVKKKKPG